MDEADAYTIPEFCVRNRISRAFFYKLDTKPDQIRIGKKILISKEAAAEWRRKLESASATQAA